ncbi:NnrS family protein [Pseudomonas sp. gcc21]|uniref:NnrS family protein n=1 Tax=Pseudomonas sp. gcc21 TaxID=2726989 RepID=UPI0014514AC3|nr:NnrS family protein [Pseudomonas sp. gcc21]QJD60191.1 NnrS family protein [Pseudomonas sp. gcc21]
MSKRAKQPLASLVFFPAATAYGALILPWSVLAQLGLLAAPPGLVSSIGHAHEMLFGFAIAVVAGYVLGPQPRRWLAATFSLWLFARIAFLGWPASYLSALANILFVAVLAYKAVPRFAGAKKWRNKTLAPILLGLCVAGAVFQGLTLAANARAVHGLFFEAILLLSALMFFMSGRMLAPAIATHLLKQNYELRARLQPQLEGYVLLLLASALIANLLSGEAAQLIAGIALFAAAGFALVRLLRWPVWRCRDRPDLVALASGYAWLVFGWLLIGSALLFQALPLSTALHGISVGALGSLTLTVMARSQAQRTQKNANAAPAIYLAAGLISLAAIARILAGTLLPVAGMHLLAAASWSVAFLSLLIFLFRFRKVAGKTARS